MPDALLWLLVLAGQESVVIPADFARTHQPRFAFPYSHGLAASLVASACIGLVVWLACARLGRARVRAAVLAAAAVLSHWALDAVVHRAELPLLGPGSPAVGLGLMDHLAVALALEAAIVVLGVALFVRRSGLPRARSIAVVGLSLAMLAFTVLGMTLAPAPPSARAMAGSSLATLLAVCALFAWLGRRTR